VTPRSPFAVPALGQLPPSPPAPAPLDLALPAGVTRIVDLTLNEGLEGPFPAAREAIADAAAALHRYPSRGSAALATVLAEHLCVERDEVFVAAGADAVIGYVTQAGLEPGDEVVVPWPSFPSFVRDTQKRGAVPVTVPLVAGHIDLDATLAAVGSRTRLVFLATPNNPTGIALEPDELERFVDSLPEHVLPVVDEAYFEYLEPGGGDGVEQLHRRGRRALVLRTFSKLYGLAGLRVGYGVGPPDVVDALQRAQRGYDVNALAQVAALASLGDDVEIRRRRAANHEARSELVSVVRSHRLEPLAGSVANFVLVDVGEDATAFAARLADCGVIVQPTGPFGAPTAVRITAGSPDDLARLSDALAFSLGSHSPAEE
jgi:histidinol-phosphate aminotransferase